jgi:hypothetical protein
VFTRARQLTVSWVRWPQCTPSHPISCPLLSSVQDRGPVYYFACFERLNPPAQPPRFRKTSCRVSATVSQLHECSQSVSLYQPQPVDATQPYSGDPGRNLPDENRRKVSIVEIVLSRTRDYPNASRLLYYGALSRQCTILLSSYVCFHTPKM